MILRHSKRFFREVIKMIKAFVEKINNLWYKSRKAELEYTAIKTDDLADIKDYLNTTVWHKVNDTADLFQHIAPIVIFRKSNFIDAPYTYDIAYRHTDSWYIPSTGEIISDNDNEVIAWRYLGASAPEEV